MEYSAINDNAPAAPTTTRRFTLPQLCVTALIASLVTFGLVSMTQPTVHTSAPTIESRGFKPTNVCAYGRGACAGSVNAEPGAVYKAIRQCTNGLHAGKCTCFGIKNRGGKPTDVQVVSENLVGDRCECEFVSSLESGEGHWGMIIGCQ